MDVGELVKPKLSKQSVNRNEEKRIEGQGEVEPLRRLDEQRNPLNSGRTQRNCCEVFRINELEQSMIGHSNNASESWKSLPWKQFRRNLFRLQKRVYKAIREGDKRKAKSLMKLILKSTAARLLAIRQVTQLNAGKKTAGVDGKASLSFEERFALSEQLKQSVLTWKHQKLREIPIPKKDGKTRILKVPTVCSHCTSFNKLWE